VAEFLAAPWDATASGDDSEGALPMHQLRILDDMEQRHFAGAAEEGKGSVSRNAAAGTGEAAFRSSAPRPEPNG
jgi:hypothetical protein